MTFRRCALVALFGFLLVSAAAAQPPAGNSGFTLEQVTGYAFPADLTASRAGDWIAWSSVQRGVRNVWIAKGPEFKPRMVTNARVEDGQELTNLAFSADGRFLVWTRGGDHGSNWPAEGSLVPDPTSSPIQPKLEIWAAPVDGSPKLLAEGDMPAPSPRGDVVAFEKGHEIWSVPIDASRPAARLFFARGENGSPTWSPDGKTLAFVTTRGSHGYIALYTSEAEPIRYLAPSTSLDSRPAWSPDGTKIAYVRRPGRGGETKPPLVPQPQPWAIWVADVKTGQGREVWRAPETLRGSYPGETAGEANLQWASGDRLTFVSYQDGWPHLYSIPVAGGTARLLTPGDLMVEYVSTTPDRRFVVYNANAGPDRDDTERRHIFRVAADGSSAPEILTSGTGVEWLPVVSSGGTLAFVGSDARRPPTTFVQALAPGGQRRAIDGDLLPADFPAGQLVLPEHVTFKAPDGTTVHGQLFKGAAAGGARRPAVVFVHGGPMRQMLLGWHYMFYYANTYAVNQYLASRGFVVLSVNYRLGIGYGYEFHNPPDGSDRGASEYQDVLAGAKYLQARGDVDPKRIGIWGGSYGGFLTAMGLARNSDVFAAGVDLHGVHNWVTPPPPALDTAARLGDGLEPEDVAKSLQVSWQSSPDAFVGTWRSPALFIHGDDDRNVRVAETIELVQRLKARGVKYEEIIIPDEIHDFLLYRNWLRVDAATVEFLERMLR